MKIDAFDRISMLLIFLAVGVTVVFYNQMPDPVPTHFSIDGTPDGFTAKPWGAYLLVLTMLGTLVLFWLIPVISPKGFRVDKFRRAYGIIKLTLMVFMFLINLVVIFRSISANLPIDRIMPGLVGLFFMVLGNFLGKVTKNFFIGIRTPWTLASEEVWQKTHRLGGYTFFFGGALMIIGSLLNLGGAWLMAVIIGAAGIPVLYSLMIYNKVEGFKSENAD